MKYPYHPSQEPTRISSTFRLKGCTVHFEVTRYYSTHNGTVPCVEGVSVDPGHDGEHDVIRMRVADVIFLGD